MVVNASAELVFDRTNWFAPQTLFLRALDDGGVEGLHHGSRGLVHVLVARRPLLLGRVGAGSGGK